ncbi:hypothetical protein ABMA27_002708 [Loxostege sticticalis]|uniref:Major facilitator superfamily (MFS) profile domain-containing protein n=1 Tax=Loxostege sticticalis TaxID=481309 RepID=A0ABR3HUL5_LOXSC
MQCVSYHKTEFGSNFHGYGSDVLRKRFNCLILFSGIKREDHDPSAPKQVPQVDMVQKITGSFGRYQFITCSLLFLVNFSVAFHAMAIMFVAPITPYVCLDNNITEACPCENPKYDTSVFTSTIITEWKLICDRRWLASFTQTVFQFGTLVGSVCFGMAADRFGRRKPLLIIVIIQLATGIVAAFAPDYWSFTVLRFLLGTSIGGIIVVSFTMVTECVGTLDRDTVSALYQAFFNLGHLLLPVFGYFLRDYNKFQLAISLSTVILLSYFVLITESPRWLIAVRKLDQAVEILERIAKMNGRPTENIKSDIYMYQSVAVEDNNQKKGNVLDLVRTPNLRKNTIAMAINWLSYGYCFYGLSQYVSQLSGNIFINVAGCAAITLLGTLTSLLLLKMLGRKTIVIVFNFVCVLCLIIMIFIPEGVGSVVFASIGVVASFIVLVVVFLYCSELFPTVVRNAALGISSMMARLGSMVAPFMLELRYVAGWLPPVVFAIVPLIAGFMTFLLPETKGCELMTTIEEGEQFGKKVKVRKEELEEGEQIGKKVLEIKEDSKNVKD